MLDPAPTMLAQARAGCKPHVGPAPAGPGWVPYAALHLSCKGFISLHHMPDPAPALTGLGLHCVWCLLWDLCCTWCPPQTGWSGCHVWHMSWINRCKHHCHRIQNAGWGGPRLTLHRYCVRVLEWAIPGQHRGLDDMAPWASSGAWAGSLTALDLSALFSTNLPCHYLWRVQPHTSFHPDFLYLSFTTKGLHIFSEDNSLGFS